MNTVWTCSMACRASASRRGPRWSAAVLVVALVMMLGAAGTAAPVQSVARQAQRPPDQAASVSGQVENVRFVVRGGVVTVYYDLLAGDPNAKFTVSLLVSRDGGRTYDLTAKTVSGDVGPGVVKGSEKRIVWEAGQDVERIDPDQFRYRIVIEGPLGPAGPAREAPAPTGTVSLTVSTDPPGATAFLDGEAVGLTPVMLKAVAVGPHRLRLVRDGYLENSRTVTLQASRDEELRITLTPAPAAAATGAGEKKGGSMAKWLIPVAAAGGAGVILAARGGSDSKMDGNGTTNRTPAIASVVVAPADIVGIESITQFEFTAQGVTDPDGDVVTVQWQFGDGTGAAGMSVNHVYGRAGAFEVTATANDGKGGTSDVKRVTVRVGNLAGAWANTFDNQTRVITLAQSGSALSGTYTNTGLVGVIANASGTLTAPRNIRLDLSGSGIEPITITGVVGPECTWFEGLVSGGGASGQTLRFTKQ